jgi:NAD(P)-dependent dehydrogenase (short-subunit alcohol dehydrogenase family)
LSFFIQINHFIDGSDHLFAPKTKRYSYHTDNSQCNKDKKCKTFLAFSEAFQETTSALGPIDIVVNNAGIMNDRFWELEVDTNLVSVNLAIFFYLMLLLKMGLLKTNFYVMGVVRPVCGKNL